MFQRHFSRISTEKWNSCPMVNEKRLEGESTDESMRFNRWKLHRDLCTFGAMSG